MTKTIIQFLLAWCFLSGIYLPSFSQYQVEHFTTENGLPSNGIKGLQWDDSTGFLWIATEAGIVRYNGMSFKTFDVNTNPDLGSNRIVFIKKNPSGKIISVSEYGTLLAVKENYLYTYLKDDGVSRINFNHYVTVAASDTLFRLCYKNAWPGKFSVDNNLVAPLNDTACVSWAVGKLYYYSVTIQQPTALEAAGNDIKKVLKIGNSLYCLSFNNKIFAFDVYKNKAVQNEIVDEEGKEFRIQKTGQLIWQGGMEVPVVLQQDKAWVLETEKGNRIRAKLVAKGIPENDYIRYAYYKPEGNYLFLGTASKGLYIVHQNQLLVKKPNSSTSTRYNAFYSQVELPNGNIITDQGQIIGDDKVVDNYNMGTHFLNRIFPLSEQELIYSLKDTFYLYNRKNYVRNMFLTPPSVGPDYAFAFSGGELYMLYRRGIGIVKNNKLQEVITFGFKDTTHFNPFDMIEMSAGKLLLASCYGLFSFDTKTRNVDTILKLPSVCFRSLHKIGDYIFIGTYGGGYYILKDGIIKAMPLDAKKYLKFSHCFMKDEKGFLWISTNNGLFKAKLEDITGLFDQIAGNRELKVLPHIYYHYFGVNDGMETTEMNGGCIPCAIKLKNKSFSFPTMDGLLWFNPLDVNLSLPSGQIFVDKLVLDNNEQEHYLANDFQFPNHAKKLDITLAVNAWCKGENLYLEYREDNEKWLPVEIVAGELKVSLTNLNAGKHALQIRKLNGFGINNYSYTNINFSVATPYYRQWWFRLLAVALFAVIIYLILQLRLKQYRIREKKLARLVDEKTKDLQMKNKQLEKNDEVKTRLISVINHDIITPLKFVHYAGSTLVEGKTEISKEEQLRTISDITETAREMQALSSQILNWIIYQNPSKQMQREEFDLHQLVNTVIRILQFPAKQKNTELVNDVPIHFVVYQHMEPLRVLIYNLVMNSVNFTKDGTITISGSFEKEQTVIRIIDTGFGMSKEQIHQLQSDEKIITTVNVDNKKGTGLGYLIIKDLLKIMKGTITVNSIKGKGTTVTVSLPAHDGDGIDHS